MSIGELTFVFWNVRGVAQALRDLLEYLELKYEDKNVEWPKEIEYTLKNVTEYQKMPKLKHDGFEVTELVPIGKYICRLAGKPQLLGKGIKDQARIECFVTKTFQARAVLVEVTNNIPKMNEVTYQKFLLKKQKQLYQMFLNKLIQRLRTQQWAFEYFSIADFYLYNALYYIQGFIPSIGQHEVINAYLRRYESIPILNKYFKSERANLPVTLSDVLLKKWTGRQNYV